MDAFRPLSHGEEQALRVAIDAVREHPDEDAASVDGSRFIGPTAGEIRFSKGGPLDAAGGTLSRDGLLACYGVGEEDVPALGSYARAVRQAKAQRHRRLDRQIAGEDDGASAGEGSEDDGAADPFVGME